MIDGDIIRPDAMFGQNLRLKREGAKCAAPVSCMAPQDNGRRCVSPTGPPQKLSVIEPHKNNNSIARGLRSSAGASCHHKSFERKIFP